MTPSDQIDQAWHLHLTYSQSYWQEFCPNILQRPLHHSPTQGGTQEKQKFDQWYSRTLSSYQRLFGAEPPTDIWPAPAIRFGRDLHFTRVNTQQNWVISKPRLNRPWLNQPQLNVLKVNVAKAIAPFKQKLDQLEPTYNRINILTFLALALLITGCRATADIPFNPLNFTGPAFLIFYSCLTAIVLSASYFIRENLLYNSEAEKKLAELGPYEVAYYAAGKRRVITTALTGLVQQGVIKADGYQTLSHTEPRKESQHPLEQEVSEAIEENGNIYSVTGLTLPTVTKIGDRVSQVVPLHSHQKHLAIFCCYLLPIIALLGLGVAKINVGRARDKPVAFLTILCLWVAFFTITALLSKTMQHRERILMTKKLQQSYEKSNGEKSNGSSTPDLDLLLAFAISGRYSLPDEQFRALKSTLIPQSSTYTVDGGAVGCGGGSCGGCGGCGGCGDCGS